MDIANKLKNNRKQLGLTQEEIAKKLHVSRQTVSNWETGKSIPDIYNLVELSNIYDISLDNLVKEDVVVMKEIKKDDKMGRLINRAIIFGGLGIIVIIISFFIKNTHFQAFLRGLSSGIMSVSVITLIVIKVVRQIQK